MKKVLSVFLSILCVLSVLTVGAGAGSFEEVVDGVFGGQEDDFYGIKYEVNILDGAKIMYKPNHDLSFDGAGWMTVTNDTPIAIDYDFVCWKDKKGNLYYEGDKVYVDGLVTLYAVWEEKPGNESNTVRVLRAAILTLQRMVLKALGIFKIVDDFESSYYSSEAQTTAA